MEDAPSSLALDEHFMHGKFHERPPHFQGVQPHMILAYIDETLGPRISLRPQSRTTATSVAIIKGRRLKSPSIPFC
eukprot:521875-Pelagomonas_calceolata.AAC.4